MTDPELTDPELTDAEAPLVDPDTRRKLLVFSGLVAALLVAGAVYFVWAQGRASDDLADRNARAQAVIDEFEQSRPTTIDDEPTATENEPAATAVPVPRGLAPVPGEVLVVNRVPGDDYGRLAIRHADGSRTLLDRSCMRVHLNADHGVCVSNNDGIIPTFTTTFFEAVDPQVEIKSYPSALPSRARISPDGTFSAVTAFVTGSSYADIGGETTTIVTIDEIDSSRLLRGTAQFVIDSDEDRFDNLDPQYWGITFADENEFYITGFYGEAPEVMRGWIEEQTLEPTGLVGSCPSLSPDGKTLVYKEMQDDGSFELVAVDLETNESWKLGETRSADDQVEWLDNDTILYALHPEGGDNAVQPEFDIWMLDIAEGSEPELFLPNADSPAVVR